MTEFSRRALHYRAALYFREIRTSPETWQTLEDLQPQLAEFEHLVLAGHIDEAVVLLHDLDYAYLWRWGHTLRVRNMYEKLLGLEMSPASKQLFFNGLGYARFNLGDVSGSIANLEESVGVYDAMPNKNAAIQQAYAVTLKGLGIAYRRFNYQTAMHYLNASLEVSSQMDDEFGSAAVLGILGDSYISLGNYELAISHLQQALTIAEKLKDSLGKAYRTHHLGKVYTEMGDYEQSVKHQLTALEIARTIGARRVEGHCFSELARVNLCQGITDQETYTFLTEALAIAKEVDHPGDDQSRQIQLAQFYWAQRQHEQALEHIHAAEIPQIEWNQHRIHAIHGLIAVCLGDQAQSDYYLQKALADVDNLLAVTDSLYTPYYTRVLVLAGLVLTATASEQPRLRQSAEDAVRAAVAINPAKGIVEEILQLLGSLAPCHRQSSLDSITTLLNAVISAPNDQQ